MNFAQFKLANGGDLGVQIVGVETTPGNAPLLAPWHVIAGDANHLRDAGAIVVDRSEYAKLKIDSFRQELASDDKQLDAINNQAQAVQSQMKSASGTDRLTLGTLLLGRQNASAFLIRQCLGHKSLPSSMQCVNVSDQDADAKAQRVFMDVF